jgi:hypothetical protein
MGIQGSQHAGLDLRSRNIATVVATAAVHVYRAAEVDDTTLAGPHDHVGSARPAHQEPGQQMLRPPMHARVWPTARYSTRLCSLEDHTAHNGQLGHILSEPLLLRIWSRLPPTCRRILHEALSVVGDTAGVEAVIQ